MGGLVARYVITCSFSLAAFIENRSTRLWLSKQRCIRFLVVSIGIVVSAALQSVHSAAHCFLVIFSCVFGVSLRFKFCYKSPRRRRRRVHDRVIIAGIVRKTWHYGSEPDAKTEGHQPVGACV